MTDLKRMIAKRAPLVAAVIALGVAMGGSWQIADADPTPALASASTVSALSEGARIKPTRKAIEGKLNLNTATQDQLVLLPAVGPAKAERIVAWRKTHGGFRRIADLRRVKGFGYKTFKRLEPFLEIKGETTLVAK